MAAQRTVVHYGPGRDDVSDRVRRFCASHELKLEAVESREGVNSMINRASPACLILDATVAPETVLELCRDLKGEAFTAIVPVVILVPDNVDLVAQSLMSGADDVVTTGDSDQEAELRLELVMRRAVRDVSVHPTTRLPGTVGIERDIVARLASGEQFAVCYADLDSFKEFNDRYGYNCGDGVIRLLSKILRDLVVGLAPGGFVGHIGGDDFIFNVPMAYLERVCDEIIMLFDDLIPYQYTAEDRKAGYFLGKDRRGSIHQVPLMTLSIGVVTNQTHPFTHTVQVSELAAEMKSYAKTLPGSLYVVDRRDQALQVKAMGG